MHVFHLCKPPRVRLRQLRGTKTTASQRRLSSRRESRHPGTLPTNLTPTIHKILQKKNISCAKSRSLSFSLLLSLVLLTFFSLFTFHMVRRKKIFKNYLSRKLQSEKRAPSEVSTMMGTVTKACQKFRCIRLKIA